MFNLTNCSFGTGNGEYYTPPMDLKSKLISRLVIIYSITAGLTSCEKERKEVNPVISILDIINITDTSAIIEDELLIGNAEFIKEFGLVYCTYIQRKFSV